MKTFLNLLGALTLAVALAGAQAPTQAGTTTANDATGNPPALQVGDPVEAGKPIHTANITIPSEFQKKNGSVVLHGILAADGSFKDLKVVTGDQPLINPSEDAVRQWVYSPCTLNGAPIEVPVYVALGFSKGAVSASVEPDLPVPTEPSRPIQDQIAEGKLFRVGHGVTPPRVIHAPAPPYTQTSRTARFSGVVVLGMIVGADGNPQDVWITRKVGLGLDQNAIETVRQWKFKPATKDGEPVATTIDVEVTFHLY